MLYRLTTPSQPDPNHEHGEAVTIARRAQEHAAHGHVTITLFDILDAEAVLRGLRMRSAQLILHGSPDLTERVTLTCHGHNTPEGIAAESAYLGAKP